MKKLLPEPSYDVLIKNFKQGNIVPDLSVFEKQIIYNLRKMSVSQIAELPDVSEGLEFAIKNAANSCSTLVELLDSIKSKRYTSTRLQRILVYSLLGISKRDMELSKKTVPYVRVLGFNERGKFLISEIAKANPKLDIVTSVKRFSDSCRNKSLSSMLDLDVWATDVFSLGFQSRPFSNLDFTKKIVIL